MVKYQLLNGESHENCKSATKMKPVVAKEQMFFFFFHLTHHQRLAVVAHAYK